jgi:hypothetical protein
MQVATNKNKNMNKNGNVDVDVVSEESFRTLLACLLRGANTGQVKDFSQYWYNMKDTNVKPLLLTCIGFIEGCVKTRDERLLQEIHKYLGQNKKQMPWNSYLFARLMLAYAYFGRWLAVQRLRQEMDAQKIPLSRYITHINIFIL